jgi:hypothetical protein
MSLRRANQLAGSPRVVTMGIDQILENLGLNWWAVLGLNQ